MHMRSSESGNQFTHMLQVQANITRCGCASLLVIPINLQQVGGEDSCACKPDDFLP